jgi:hypothetical protein
MSCPSANSAHELSSGQTRQCAEDAARVESLRVGPLPRALGMRYGAPGDIAVFVLAAAGMYLARPGRKPPARAYPSELW